MNSRNFKTIMLLSLFVMLLGSVVKAQDLYLIAQVPFEFNTGNMIMPVGEYHIVKMNNHNGKLFRIRGENAVATRIVQPTYSLEVSKQTVLIFNKYRENGGEASYFLAQIRVAGDTMGVMFPTTRAERTAALRAARRDVITLVVQRANPPAE